MTTSPAFDTDVLIVGAGPMGATTALALATYGIRCQVVSRTNWTANTPRAHITNQRAGEVLRDLGVEEDARREATPWGSMGDMLFTTSLAGPEIARLRAFGTSDARYGDYLRSSPCSMMDLPQSKMEPLLIKHAAAKGARFAFNTQYEGFTEDPQGITVQLCDRDSGRKYTRRARYLVGADGARSAVMEHVGLAVEGQLARAAQAYVQFRADLTRYAAHRPSVLYWIVSSDAAFGEIGMGLLRAVQPWTQWIAGWGFDMAQGDPDFSTPAVVDKVRKLVGDPSLNIEIDSSSVWYVNQAHAPIYAKGRVFCGGDAVHRHPPSNGLGSNTCIGDAFNLAWKLAFVVKGYAGQRLLDSYSLERAPVGAQVVARANKSRMEYAPLHRCFREPGAKDPVGEGLAQLGRAEPSGATRRADLAEALALKNYEYNSHGVELNQRYTSAAVIPDQDNSAEQWLQDPELYAQPTTRPGAKLPHEWLVGRDGRRVSTLDVVGKGMFSLVTGLSGTAWVDAVATLGLPYLRAVVIGTPGALDLYQSWIARREVEEGGALLVRPDGYIAWRAIRGVDDTQDAHQQLSAVLESVLHRSERV